LRFEELGNNVSTRGERASKERPGVRTSRCPYNYQMPMRRGEERAKL